MSKYIYHGKPEPMIGNTLMPLNKMSSRLDEIRKLHLSKYQGREEILQREVPLLDCLWNDVLQFLPFHPRKVFELQIELGLIPEMPHYSFYEIDAETLDQTKLAVFFKTAPGEDNTETKWFQNVDFQSLQHVPEATVAYYKTFIGTGELPFNYQFIPHVMYRGKVDILQAGIVTL
ncbi:MAG: hypothetical protein QG659_340 [Patescibacteria group bacterium]|jgi:hypothetical protein|nr:hypothetical protein [Patescibacteria group bacterium]